MPDLSCGMSVLLSLLQPTGSFIACGIQFSDQGLNPVPCIANMESQLLDHQGNPCHCLLLKILPHFCIPFLLSLFKYCSTKSSPYFNHSGTGPYLERKVKVVQSCLTLCGPILQARILKVGSCCLLQGIFPTQVSLIAGGFFTT